MISYLIGEVAEITSNSVIVEVNQMGFEVLVSATTLDRIPGNGKQVKLHTYFNVKEDVMQLFGFLTKEELEMFRLLISVNGIGPKAGLGILSGLSVSELRFAILADDAKTISRAPGIGPKTAKKLILELKDKLNLEDMLQNPTGTDLQGDGTVFAENKVTQDAVEALVSLGYSGSDALRAVRKVKILEEMEVEAVLREALKYMVL